MNVNLNIPQKLFSGKSGFVKFILVIFVSITLPSILTYTLGAKNQVTINLDDNQLIENKQPFKEDSVKSYSNREVKEIENFSDEWDTKRYTNKNNLYCANQFSSFPFPDLPYKNNIVYGKNGLKFSYINTVSDGSNPLILSVGNNQKDIRFFIQESNPQLIGVEKLDSELNLSRTDPIILKDVPKLKTEIEIQIRGNVNKGNDITYILNISYISSQNNEKIEESFSFNLKSPDTNPSNYNVIIASKRGKCIKPTGYELCN